MYLALYRKYRPRTFDEVISQEHITTTLKNQVAGGTAAHAYLFTGSRGTGKTTCAKIMAMAVNCLSPKDGNPCLECERCREIANGETTDIVEMDAASNNGVNDVRELRDEVAYTPISCKYRVYIIDEVHMLSTEAFNALLKTLEEPPEHIKFILATTELHKVPATISSRCQRFEFRRVDVSDSAKRLCEVAKKEGFQLDENAAELISRVSDGGMRDALSLLDRCLSAGEHITEQLVRDCAGIADNKHLFEFARMIAQNDTAGCIRLLGELHKGSKDVVLIIDELSGIFRDIMLYKTAPNETGLLSVLPEDHGNVAAAAEMYELENILRCLTLLQQCADNISRSRQRKTLAEMCLVKMCTGAGTGEQSVPRIAAKRSEPTAPSAPSIRIKEPVREELKPKPYEEMSENERLIAMQTEKLIKAETEKPRPAPEVASEASPAPTAEPPFEETPESFLSNDYPINTEPPVEPAENAPEETNEPKESAEALELTKERWREAVGKMDYFYSAMFRDSEARLTGNSLEIFTDDALAVENIKDEEHARLEGIISELLGMKIRLTVSRKQKPKETDKNASKLERFLETAKQLGIEVQNQNDQ